MRREENRVTKMNRMNKMGQLYYLSEIYDDMGISTIQTEIRRANGAQRIIVDADIHLISEAWFKWMMHGVSIQIAFHFMTPSEREFIKTGITEAEWDELFPPNTTTTTASEMTREGKKEDERL
jgi:hypothetical protein